MTAIQILDIFLPLFGVLLVGVIVPIYLVNRANKERREDAIAAAAQHREDRDAEWARQDRVADLARKATDDLAISQKEIADQAAEAARLLLINNKQVAKVQGETNSKLDTIHTLVNSNMTAAMQSEFDATKRELAMMREVMELKKAAGLQPTAEVLASIASTETKLQELSDLLEDRARAQQRVILEEKGSGA
jgi:hypothetical protein